MFNYSPKFFINIAGKVKPYSGGHGALLITLQVTAIRCCCTQFAVKRDKSARIPTKPAGDYNCQSQIA
jgi:hypothetical protein